MSIDLTLLEWINRKFAHPVLDPFFVLLSSEKFWITILLTLLILSLASRKKKWVKYAVSLILIMSVTDIFASHLMKPFFKRLRPCHEYADVRRIEGKCGAFYSMPSNHASNAFSAAFFTFFLRPRDRRIFWGFLVAALVSYSRIYLGVHYPSDVLIGFVVGAVSGGSGYLAVKRLF